MLKVVGGTVAVLAGAAEFGSLDVTALSSLAALATSDTVLAAILLTALVIKVVAAAELGLLEVLVTGAAEFEITPLPVLTGNVLGRVATAGWSELAALDVVALVAAVC